MKKINLLGYACGLGSNKVGCELGPQLFLEEAACGVQNIPCATSVAYLQPLVAAQAAAPTSIMAQIAELNQRLAAAVKHSLENHHFPVVLGGDHSSAMGTWSGVHAAADAFGLLWFDAHMDSHTPSTSPTGNIHGMPVASLLGFGPDCQTEILTRQAKLDPRHLCLFGVRSFEAEEQLLLNKLGVKVMLAADILKDGLRQSLLEAVQYVNRGVSGFGISIDLDVFDPEDLPGVGSPVVGGLRIEPFLEALRVLGPWLERFLALEIAELNPRYDLQGRTVTWANRLLHRLIRIKLNDNQSN